jgi:hypothetical protein
MKKTLLTLAAVAALAMACSARMEAAAATVMTLSTSGGVSATIDETGACVGTGCGALVILVDGAHGTIRAISKSKGAFDGYTVSATGVGGGDSTLPTLMNLNQINAENTNPGGGTLTTTFFDTAYPTVGAVLNIGDSNVDDKNLAADTIDFDVFTGPSAGPATTQIYHNTLTGVSDSNGLGGVDVANPNNPTASIETQTIMAFTGVGTLQANITVANIVVPEPAGIVLMGTTLLAVSALIRRKQAKRT